MPTMFVPPDGVDRTRGRRRRTHIPRGPGMGKNGLSVFLPKMESAAPGTGMDAAWKVRQDPVRHARASGTVSGSPAHVADMPGRRKNFPPAACRRATAYSGRRFSRPSAAWAPRERHRPDGGLPARKPEGGMFLDQQPAHVMGRTPDGNRRFPARARTVKNAPRPAP